MLMEMASISTSSYVQNNVIMLYRCIFFDAQQILRISHPTSNIYIITPLPLLGSKDHTLCYPVTSVSKWHSTGYCIEMVFYYLLFFLIQLSSPFFLYRIYYAILQHVLKFHPNNYHECVKNNNFKVITSLCAMTPHTIKQ